MQVSFFVQKKAHGKRHPGTPWEAMTQWHSSRPCMRKLGAWPLASGFLVHQGKTVWFLKSCVSWSCHFREQSIPIVVSFSFLLWSSTENNMLQNFTTKDTVVSIVTPTVFGKSPFQKIPIAFTSLEIPALGTILHVDHTCVVFSLKLWATPVPSSHRLCCVVPAQAQTIVWKCPVHWFTISSFHVTVYHLSCVLICCYRISLIHDAVSFLTALKFLT